MKSLDYSVYITIIRPDGERRKAIIRCNHSETKEKLNELKDFYKELGCFIQEDYFSFETWIIERNNK